MRNRGFGSVDNRQHFSLWYVVLFMLSLQSVLFNQRVESLAYSDFQALLHAGKVKEVLIGDDSLSGTVDLRGAEAVLPAQAGTSLPKDNLANHPFITARVSDPSLVGELQAAHARFSGQVENRPFAMSLRRRLLSLSILRKCASRRSSSLK
jgi:cell division protease FtsH